MYRVKLSIYYVSGNYSCWKFRYTILHATVPKCYVFVWRCINFSSKGPSRIFYMVSRKSFNKEVSIDPYMTIFFLLSVRIEKKILEKILVIIWDKIYAKGLVRTLIFIKEIWKDLHIRRGNTYIVWSECEVLESTYYIIIWAGSQGTLLSPVVLFFCSLEKFKNSIQFKIF